MMYCVRCGAKANEKRKICAECGMRLITPEALLKLLKKAEAEKTSEPAKIKKPAAETERVVKENKNHEPDVKKRVTPLYENPTQPKRRSIFDEDDIIVEEVKILPKKKLAAPEKKKKNEPVAKKTNPVVKLPPRKTEDKAMESRSGRKGYSKDMFLIPERRESAKSTSGIKRPSARAVKLPDAKTAKTKSRQSKTADDEKRHKAKKAPPRKTVKGKPAARKKKETFTEKHLRSIVSMTLLIISVSVLLIWGFGTKTGLKTFAQYGIGTNRGYILLGDDCMKDGNYQRAVEYYYKALTDEIDFDAAWKLSEAYRHTGDIERETSALLLLMDHYPSENAPYQRMLQLYPDPRTRPERVNRAISMYEN